MRTIIVYCGCRFPEVEKLSPPVLQLDEVHFYYSKEMPIFDKIDISANSESRICVVSILLIYTSLGPTCFKRKSVF